MTSLDRVRQKPGPATDGIDSPSAPASFDDGPSGGAVLWAVAAAALFLFAVVVLTWEYIL